jgi:hypothetical protein
MDMLGSPEVMGFLKTSGIFTGIAGVVFVVVKFKLVEVVSIENETVALRQSWGRVKHYYPRTARFVSWLLGNFVLAPPLLSFVLTRSPRFSLRLETAGRLVVLHPGAHEVFRGMHSLIVVSLREIVLKMPEETVTYRGRTLHYKLTPTLKVAYDGTWWGEQNLLKSVFSVRDTNIHDGDIGVLRDKLEAIFGNATAKIQVSANPDSQGFPKLKAKHFRREVGRRVLDLHGYWMCELLPGPMSWTEAQIERDGRVEAAKIEAKAKTEAATILASALQAQAPPEMEPEDQGPNPRPHVVVAAEQLLTDTA